MIDTQSRRADRVVRSGGSRAKCVFDHARLPSLKLTSRCPWGLPPYVPRAGSKNASVAPSKTLTKAIA